MLTKDGINSLAEMKKYLDWAEKMGVDNVVFRQLMKFDKATTKMDEVANYSEEKRVELEPILEKIDHDKDFKFQKQVLGYYYYVEVYKYKGIDVVTEIADLSKIDEENARQKALGGNPKI